MYYKYIHFLYIICNIDDSIYFFSNGLISSDVEEGGETVFPSAKVNSSSIPFYNELSECAKRGISVKPKMGDALLFWSMRPDGTLDPTSLHGEILILLDVMTKLLCFKGLCNNILTSVYLQFPLGGCPVIKGDKWSSTKWIRVHEYKV